MKRKKKTIILSVFIAAVLLVSALPMSAFAEGNETFPEDVDATPKTTEEAQPEESGGSEENYHESSNVKAQEAEASESNLDTVDKLVGLASKTDIARITYDESNKKITVDVGGLILLSNAYMDFSEYTISLSTLSGDYADLTKSITIEEKSTDKNGEQTTTSKEYSFLGLGSETYPFSGKLESQDRSYGVILNVPFFENVDVTKTTFLNFNTLKMKQKGNTTSAMLAAKVSGEVGKVGDWASIKIELDKESVSDGGTDTDYLPTALISTMDENASLSLGEVSYTGGAEVNTSSNAGLLCNTMEKNSSVSVQNLTVAEEKDVTITATSGSAGGLVGLMRNGASLTVTAKTDTAETIGSNFSVTGQNAIDLTNSGTSLMVNAGVDTSVTIGSNFTIKGQNAGGLIGSGEDVNLDSAKATINGATVKGSNAAGGLIGSYTTGETQIGFVSYDGSEESVLKVNSITMNATADSAYTGGLFGMLELKRNFDISNASVTSTITGKKAFYGGLVGQVRGDSTDSTDSTDSLRALTIRGSSNPSTTTYVNLSGYAGAVAVIGNDVNPVYVNITTDEFKPTFNGVNLLGKNTYFGGVAAYIKSDSVLELTGNVTIVCDKIAEANGYGGGVLGNAERGSTLCLGGTTDLSGTKFKEIYINDNTGQIVGTQESALIYAKSNWKLIRQSTAQELDDIGTYGQVIRLGGNMGMGTPDSEQSGLSPNLIEQNGTTHRTVFLESVKNAPTLSGDTFTITSADQLALIAIEEQTKCAFGIFGESDEKYYLNSKPNITLGDKISLAHTGITGLQRDNGDCNEYGGTLDGQNYTLTIAAGEIYGYRGDGSTAASENEAGSGQIHGHTQVGFFSHANATVKNLTVNGDMNLRFRTKTNKDTSTTYLAGGLVAKNTGDSIYEKVTTDVNIKYQGTDNGTVGGLVGYGSALTLTGCTGNSTINVGSSAVYAGGLIGQCSGVALSVSGTTLSGTITADGAAHARLGGLVSRIAKGNYDEVTVTLNGITVNGQTITGTNINGSTVNQLSPSCDGLLGYEWNNANVTFGNKSSHTNGLTVTGSSSVTVNGTTETAGLVYAATGYWQVNDIKLENLSISSKTGDLGLLICRGWRKDIPADAGTATKPYLLYLEETNYHAYNIQSNNVQVINDGGYFDEWVVYTCESKETITNNGNSVISIATASGDNVEGARVGLDPSDDNCTSYQNRTEYGKTADANPNARYYYDLDIIREKATANRKLDTPGEMVLWAVWRYAEKTNGEKSNIEDYFSTGDITGANMNGNGNCIDLTGYAYYPITVDGFNLSITNINVKFANEQIETAESKTEDPLDSLNRTTDGTTESHTQHYMLHSGILLNYQNSSAGSDCTMTVDNVTFQGTIGKGPNGGSGALICGQLGGYTNATSPKYAKLDIKSVVFNNAYVNTAKTNSESDYAPLLVNRVGSYSSLSAQNVETSGYADVTSTSNPAATSLIGHVGGENATNISLAFNNGIALNGKPEKSIFSHATLLESFQYQSGCSGYYRFYNNGDSFTFGREISESIEYQGLQKYYSKNDPNEKGVIVKDGDISNFKEYLPYVCKPYNDEYNYHELEVNLESPDLTDGCGTYDDPYIINSPRQLMRAADFINGNSPQNGWKVNKVKNPEITKTSENANHSTYEVGVDWNDTDIRTYMRSAYYKITTDKDLELNSFSGFGSGAYPFEGVIDGNNTTITINATRNESGLINVSYGSVVQNLTLNYIGTKSFAGVEQPDEKSNEITEKSYFGGIIGTIKGGDNLVNNVQVKFDDDFEIITSFDLQCAGGFVGLIQGGGVVFRNMGDATNNPGYKKTNSTRYVDKYIGRVLDGYAINEVDSAVDETPIFAAGKNTDDTPKNYSIPDITSEAKIEWSDNGNGIIEINNAQQMIIFADIINSGAASGGTAPAYASDKAKTRNADYSQIGNVSDDADNAFVAARKDAVGIGSDNYPYLIAKYVKTEGPGSFWNACKNDTGISISFTSKSIDLSPYGNGYRGIGGRYSCNANGGTMTNNTPKINSVTGNNVSIHVANDIEEYRMDNFYTNAVGGLFNVLRHEGATIEGVNVYGTVKVRSGFGSGDSEDGFLARAPVGGVIGRDYCPSDINQTLTLSKVSFGSNTKNPKSEIYGECVTGGLIGSSGSHANTVLDNGTKNKTVLLLTNCSYQNVNITGGVASGGFIAAAVSNSNAIISINEAGESPALNNGIKIQVSDDINSGQNADISILFEKSGGNTSNGLAGLVGFCGTSLTIKGDENTPVTVENINVQGAGANKRARVGGLVGFMANNNSKNEKKADCTIQYANLNNINIGMSGSSYDDNAGSIMGTWYSNGTLKCQDCVVEKAIIQANSSGGIVGYAARGQIQSIRITLSNVTVKKSGTNMYAGGLGGQVSCTFYGQNILMKRMTYVDSSNDINKLGRFFGTGTNARLIGMTIQDTANLPTYEIRGVANADLGTSNYVVYAGYNSRDSITTGGHIATEPSQAVAGIGNLHGDTVDPTTVRSAAADTAFYQNVGTKDKLTENICSTYNAQQENQENKVKADFPVVLIDGDASVLKQYLNAATNGGFDSLRKYQSQTNNTSGGKIEIDIDRYLYDKDSGTFSKADEKTCPATLVYHKSTGEFTTTAQYDNQKDTFTLVTVTMTGYSTDDKFVIHIPVIVRRMLQVDFMATMTSGTVFNKTDDFYSETKNHALASKGENITGYLTFHYNSNASDIGNPASYDWQSYMEGGGDLLGYFKKTVNTGKDKLPVGTKITLIDCQNDDRRYYAEVGENETSLELFNGGNLTYKASNDTDEFTPATLSDLLQIEAVGADDAANVKWVRLENETGATVKATDGYYYRLYNATNDSDVMELYTLTVGNSSPTENYFVVISVPNEKNHRLTLVKSGMKWSNSTTSPPLEVHQVHRYDPTKLNVEDMSEASFNYLDNYKQKLDDNTEVGNEQVQTSSAKVQIPVAITNTVTFNPKNYDKKDPLYQKLVISLKKTEKGSTKTVSIPSDAVAVTNTDSSTTTENAVRLYAYYKDSDNNPHYYVWRENGLIDKGTTKEPAISYSWSASGDSAEMVLPFAAKTDAGFQYIDLAALREVSGGKLFLEAETTLEMSVASVMTNNTIPYDAAKGETIENYTKIDATSILSFTESGLSYSTLKENTSGNKRYYLNTERKAILKLDYTNIDQLGINLLEDKTATIDANLTLDLSNMEGFVGDVTQFKTLSEADYVQFSLSLQKKGEKGYSNVPIGDYLSGAKTSDGNSLTNYTIKQLRNNNGSYRYYNEQTGKFDIPISFAVRMDVREFANYRIRASVKIVKGEKNQLLDVDETNAFITYTYAKINVNGYWE